MCDIEPPRTRLNQGDSVLRGKVDRARQQEPYHNLQPGCQEADRNIFSSRAGNSVGYRSKSGLLLDGITERYAWREKCTWVSSLTVHRRSGRVRPRSRMHDTLQDTEPLARKESTSPNATHRIYAVSPEGYWITAHRLLRGRRHILIQAKQSVEVLPL